MRRTFRKSQASFQNYSENNEEFKKSVLGIPMGWRGITLGVALLLIIIDYGFLSKGYILIIALIMLIVVGKKTLSAIKEAKTIYSIN